MAEVQLTILAELQLGTKVAASSHVALPAGMRIGGPKGFANVKAHFPANQAI